MDDSRLARMLATCGCDVRRQRKIAKYEAQTGIVFLQELFSKTGEIAAGRALKIGKFFQRHWGIGVAPHVH